MAQRIAAARRGRAPVGDVDRGAAWGYTSGMGDHRNPDDPRIGEQTEPEPPNPSDVPVPPHPDAGGGTEEVPEPPNRDEVDTGLPGREHRELWGTDDVNPDAGAVEPPD
ncbi:hypothetical protein [Prauserella alba]|uniref:Uncharacterized protein n=1 Tax=Prauserella alba TaxID=176898 RepID=A0ABN1VI18_9PSEU|nr:hypothetical protein [Prauserella alba]MCP2180529.1 hypothetical protein [Prauserella alba]